MQMQRPVSRTHSGHSKHAEKSRIGRPRRPVSGFSASGSSPQCPAPSFSRWSSHVDGKPSRHPIVGNCRPPGTRGVACYLSGTVALCRGREKLSRSSMQNETGGAKRKNLHGNSGGRGTAECYCLRRSRFKGQEEDLPGTEKKRGGKGKGGIPDDGYKIPRLGRPSRAGDSGPR